MKNNQPVPDWGPVDSFVRSPRFIVWKQNLIIGCALFDCQLACMTFYLGRTLPLPLNISIKLKHGAVTKVDKNTDLVSPVKLFCRG